jgi:outer membrane biosynthesis protein TonB
MFTFDRLDAQRIAISAAGALLFSTICIGGAVAPAQAAVAPATLSAWQADATKRLDAAMAAMPADARRSARQNAEVGAAVAPDGSLSRHRMLRSSGSRSADTAMLRKVRTLRLAPLPGAVTGKDLVLKVALVDATRPSAPAAVRYAAR